MTLTHEKPEDELTSTQALAAFSSWWLRPMTRAQFDAEVATRFALNKGEARSVRFANLESNGPGSKLRAKDVIGQWPRVGDLG